MIVKNNLSVGDNKAIDVIYYKDPDGVSIEFVSFTLDAVSVGYILHNDKVIEKQGNLELVFNDKNYGAEGTFFYTPYQLDWLKFRVPDTPLVDNIRSIARNTRGEWSPLVDTVLLAGK